MRLSLVTVFAAVLLCGVAGASQQQPHYVPRATLRRRGGLVTVNADNPRPLWQALSAVREEYGWSVDYEDPRWGGADLRDVSPPAWHAAHPGKSGSMEPAGGAFQCTYTETPDMWNSPESELDVLEKIVSDYNASGNPGKFVVRAQSDGSYAVIGIEGGSEGLAAPAPLLDTSISLTPARRSGLNTLSLILASLSAKSGASVGIGEIPFNLLFQSTITVGATNLPARSLLIEFYQALRVKMVWDLWFLPDLQSYALNLREAALSIPGAFGGRRLVPISPWPGP
ncbi:MAG: hypothetical protein ACRD2B_15015 [Terriglobia bacterium]